MAHQVADRIQQTGTANTTVSFTLSATTAGYQSFSSAITTGNTTYYSANDGTNWEVGIGTLTNSTTLTRTTILSSSNSGSAVTFSGTVTVFCDYPAAVAVYSSNNPGTAGQVLTSNGTGTVPSWGAVYGSYSRTSVTATASQTTFTVSYTAPYIEVYYNGVLLNASDYTATNGTTVVLATGASAGAIVEFIAYNTSVTVPVAGSNTQVQYNNGGALGAFSGFTFDGTNLNIPFGTSGSATPSAKIALALSMIA